jgi:hypothetical protein
LSGCRLSQTDCLLLHSSDKYLYTNEPCDALNIARTIDGAECNRPAISKTRFFRPATDLSEAATDERASEAFYLRQLMNETMWRITVKSHGLDLDDYSSDRPYLHFGRLSGDAYASLTSNECRTRSTCIVFRPGLHAG